MRPLGCCERTAQTGWFQTRTELLCFSLANFNPAIHFSYWKWTSVQGFVFFVVVVAVFNFSHGRYHYLGLIQNEKPKRAFAVGLLGYFQILDSSFAAWHEEADAYLVLKVTWITQEYFSRERIMSATFPGFVFLLGILHVCSGKTPTSALQSLADIKRQESNNSAVFI